LFDGNGMLVLNQAMLTGNSRLSSYIDLSALPNGMYYIEVPVGAGTSVTKKVIKQ
jgi:hypothetical protein